MAVIVCRACIQSITIDEADTWLAFAGRPGPSHWEAGSNNHVLNSMLIRLFTTVFGLHHLTMRMPALIGAGLYIVAATYLVCIISEHLSLRLIVFGAMVFNPFVMDYLVAARGYSLALGFLLSGMALCLRGIRRSPEGLVRPQTAAVCAGCLSLSFCSNFAFGIASAVTFAAVAVQLCLPAQPSADTRSMRRHCYRTVGVMTVSSVLTTWFFAGPALLHWRKDDLIAGTRTLRGCLSSIISASVLRPNPYLVNPPLERILESLNTAPAWAAVAVFFASAVLVVVARCVKKPVPESAPRLRLAMWFCGIAVLTVGGHVVLHRLLGILYPVGRTAVFLAPLSTLAIGSVVAIPLAWRPAEKVRGVLVAALAAVSLYFLCCLRLTYFGEWAYNADANRLYFVLDRYQRSCGLRSVSANWRYVAVLNYYRSQAGDDRIEEVPNGPQEPGNYPSGRDAYVVYYPQDEEFVKRRHLDLVYYGRATDAAIALDPKLLAGCADQPAAPGIAR